MKIKMRKAPRTVLAIVLAVSLIVTSSLAAMFISNAVTLPKNSAVSANVVQEGVVGAASDSEAVSATKYGGDGIWGLWAGTSDRDGMNDYWQLTADGENTVSVTKTLSKSNYYFSLVCGTTENWHYNYKWDSDATFNNNYSSVITGSGWQTQTWYDSSNNAYNVHRLYIWCNVANTQVKISVNTSTNAITIAPTVEIPDVANSVSISADPAAVTSTNSQTTLTATASSVPAALDGKYLTFTFYADDARLGSATGVVSGNSATASYNVSQADKRTVNYKVTVSYTGYASKTSDTVTVTNNSISEPAFKMWGASSNFHNGEDFDQIDSAYGSNVYYKEVTVTETGENKGTNRFKLKRKSDDHYFSMYYDDDGHGNAHYLAIDGDSYTAIDNGNGNDSQKNYLVFNPSTTGTYRIYVDQTNTDAPKVWVEGERDIFITTKTAFNSSVVNGVVPDTNVAAFESADNTGFKGYVSGTIWSAAAIIDEKPFMLSTKKGVDYDLEYAIRDDLCAGVTLTQQHVMVGHEEDGEYAEIYKIKSNVVNTDKYTKNIILHVDTANKQIWATATFDQTDVSSKTVLSGETVRYYFAVTETDHSKFVEKGKMHIHYWNNSLAHSAWTGSGNYYGNATAYPVNESGSTTNVTDKTDNKIYVDLSKPASYTISDTDFNYDSKGWGTEASGYNVTAYIYCADLPVWATSFAYAGENTTGYSYSKRGIVLNPNRVYVAYGWGDEGSRAYYIAASRLDKSLWSQNSEANADEASTFIKTFKTNLIKYNAASDSDLNPAMNKALLTEYQSRGIENELYFGGFWDYTGSVPEFADSTKTSNWKVWNNLAQRNASYIGNRFKGETAYYATVWDLAGNMLDRSKTNNLGGYLLTDTFQKDVLPFFDYDNMSSSIGTVYKNVDFPFYKTTYKGITSYSYDSMSDYNRAFDAKNKKYTYTGYVALNNMQAYKPFSDQSKSFANEFDINFYMTPTGYLKDSSNQNQDIAFNFSGDDDVWVYIDGVKVLDLGGAHMISAASINLSDMKVYYKTPAKSTMLLDSVTDTYAVSADAMYAVDLAKLFEVYGVDFNKKDATTEHTLQMFYMERGENESNCSISFNLPQNSGLRIQNEIDTDDVNSGLVDATLWAANHDYFQYYVENTLATNEQQAAALNYTGYGITSLPDAATGLSDDTFYSTTPKFPANNGATVYRKSQNLQQLLLKKGITGGADSAKPTLSNGIFGLTGLTYALTDAYADGAVDDTLSGKVAAKESTNGVYLNLLYGQSATFESKITPHTWLVIKQENELYNPTITEDGNTIARGDDVAAGVAAGDQRNASRFYTTSYTIKDDASGKTVGSESFSNNLETAITAHALDNSTGYYFSNYSNEASAEHVAATYKFVNKPNTGTINITKRIDAGTAAPDEKASFWFDVTFDNVFGIDDGTDFSEYNVKYRVYNEDGTFVERNYSTTHGIMLRHNQTAVITGVPSGTLYKVIERSRGGYSLDTVTKTSYRNGVVKKTTTMNDSSQYEKASDIDYMSKTDTGAYLADFLYINKRVALKVVIHYYDRKLENGVPVNIDTTPTTATVSYSEAPGTGYEVTDGSGNLLWINTKGYIDHALEGKLDNVVDQYFYWTTNSEAIAGIQTKDQVTYTLQGGTYVKSTSKYTGTAYHLDAYGKPLSTPTASDKWVTYYDNKGKDLTDQFDDAVIDYNTTSSELYNQLAEIDVWAYNEPKTYTATVYGAAEVSDLTQSTVNNEVKVGKGTIGSVTDYYNTRFGETAGAGSAIDYASDYMQQYGRMTSFTGQYPSNMTTVKRTIGEYKFVGWATDPEGQNIFTNDYYCGYRILSDISLYPVYMKNPTTDFGLTITPNVNDTYIASNGTEYTRLNITYNPYNVTGDKDTNITDIAQVIIRMEDGFNVGDVDLETVREKVKAALDTLPTSDPNATGAHTILVEIEGTKKVSDKYNANEVNYKVTFGTPADDTTVKLNNKNRVMLTQTYNSSLLKENANCYKLIALGAMKYNGTWTISNNYLYYLGGECQ